MAAKMLKFFLLIALSVSVLVGAMWAALGGSFGSMAAVKDKLNTKGVLTNPSQFLTHKLEQTKNLASGENFSSLHKCQSNGKVTYTNDKCAGSDKTLKLEAKETSGGFVSPPPPRKEEPQFKGLLNEL